MSALTAAATLGVTIDSLTGDGEALLRRATQSGAGAVWNREASRDAPILAVARAAGLDLISVVPVAALPAALTGAEDSVVLGLGAVSLAGTPAPFALPPVPPESVTALAVTVEGMPGSADPKRMEDALRAVAGPLRAGGWRQPFWLVDLAPAEGTPLEEHAGWLVRHAAHALALAMPRVFFRISEERSEPVLQALSLLAAWLDGADRVTWLARGQYRAEFAGRPSRFLLWAEPGITRLPSSFQGPLHMRDLAGGERRIETSHLKLAEIPILVERRA